jgi:hypothetical protein
MIKVLGINAGSLPNIWDADFLYGPPSLSSEAEHKTGHGRLEILDRHPQGDQGVKKAIGQLDATCRKDKRPDLRAHRSARLHRPSFLWR